MLGPIALLSRLLLSLSASLPAGLLAQGVSALPDDPPAPFEVAAQSAPQDWMQPGVVYNGPVVTVNPAPERPQVQPQAWTGVDPVQTVTAPRDPSSDPHQRGLSLGGPRFGVSYINGGGYDKLLEAVRKAKPDSEVDPFMTQFGWQVEYRMFRTSRGVTALTEFIPLVGGMDQGLALPSATWLVGLRMPNGFEFGVGPNVGLSGAGMMAGMGYTVDLGGLNIPINLAAGRGAYQTTSVAFSTGFNL
jgi:hypothetical protein